jgi:hypothetical protein
MGEKNDKVNEMADKWLEITGGPPDAETVEAFEILADRVYGEDED